MEHVGIKEKINDNRLIVVLILLIMVIIGLTVGIVVVKSNSGTTGEVESEDEVAEEQVENRRAQSDEWTAMMDDIEEKAKKMLESATPDINAINKLFDDAIEKAESWERYDLIIVAINLRKELYLAKDLKREALDSLLSVDPSILTDSIDKYNFCTDVIELAREFGDESTVSKYEELRKEVEADYTKYTNEVQEYVDAVNALDAEFENEGEGE